MLQIDRYSQQPIYEQIIKRFEFLILQEQISLDTPMPSVRSLSQELSVNPNTLQKAYSELERRGLCYTVPGNGRYVAKNAKELLYKLKSSYFEKLSEIVDSLHQVSVPLDEIIEYVKTSYQKNEQLGGTNQ